MNQSIQSDQYDVLIKKIRRKRIMVNQTENGGNCHEYKTRSAN